MHSGALFPETPLPCPSLPTHAFLVPVEVIDGENWKKLGIGPVGKELNRSKQEEGGKLPGFVEGGTQASQ